VGQTWHDQGLANSAFRNAGSPGLAGLREFYISPVEAINDVGADIIAVEAEDLFLALLVNKIIGGVC
jgi:hypothetical protein